MTSKEGAALDEPIEPGAKLPDAKHHPECNTIKCREDEMPCNCFLSRKAPLTEMQKGKFLQEARKEYLRTHKGSPADVEDASWVAVWRKAMTLVSQ